MVNREAEATDNCEEEADDGGGEIFLMDLGGERKALIFRDAGGDATRSYSSMRLARSSSEVTDTKASRSSVGN